MKATIASSACCLLLLHPNQNPNHHSPSTLRLTLPPHNQQKWHWRLPIPPPKLTFTPVSLPTQDFLVRPLWISRARKWDSNSESFRTHNFDYGYDDDDQIDDTSEQWDDVLEDYIDSIWIFKVFRSYGWMLPFIIIPLLLATGPKAFLLALAVPLGQSTFSFAIQRMVGKRPSKSKSKSRSTKRSHAPSSRFVRREKGNDTRNQRNRRVKMGYQSWVPQDEDLKDASDKDVPNYGGWDELINLGSQSSAQTTGGSSNKRPSSEEESSLSSRMSKSDTPLLLRLLISVFPFFSSWTKML